MGASQAFYLNDDSQISYFWSPGENLWLQFASPVYYRGKISPD